MHFVLFLTPEGYSRAQQAGGERLVSRHPRQFLVLGDYCRRCLSAKCDAEERVSVSNVVLRYMLRLVGGMGWAVELRASVFLSLAGPHFVQDPTNICQHRSNASVFKSTIGSHFRAGPDKYVSELIDSNAHA